MGQPFKGIHLDKKYLMQNIFRKFQYLEVPIAQAPYILRGRPNDVNSIFSRI